MPQKNRRLLILSFGLLMTLSAFYGCTLSVRITPTQTDTTAPAGIETTVPFGKEDPVLPVTKPGEGNVENVTQLRLHDVGSGWREPFNTPRGAFFAATSVQMLIEGLTRCHIDVSKLDLSAYDDAFFARNRLVVIPRTSNSGSVRYSANVVQADDGVHISLVGKMPEVGTADMADWLVLVPLSYSGFTGKITVENGKSPVTNTQRYAIHRF